MFSLPTDIIVLINSFVQNNKQEIIQQIPHAVKVWWWKRGYIKSYAGGLYWVKDMPNFFV